MKYVEEKILEEFSNSLERRSCLVIRALPTGRLKNHSRNPLPLSGTDFSRGNIYLQCAGAMHLNPSIPVFVIFKDGSGQLGVHKFDGTPNSIFGGNNHV